MIQNLKMISYRRYKFTGEFLKMIEVHWPQGGAKSQGAGVSRGDQACLLRPLVYILYVIGSRGCPCEEEGAGGELQPV